MSERGGSTRHWWLPAVALLPPVVVVCVIVGQAGELSLPAGCTRNQCAKLLKHIASERSTALSYAWIGAALLLLAERAPRSWSREPLHDAVAQGTSRGIVQPSSVPAST